MSDNSKIRRRFRCPKCGSLDSIKWGARNGVQRYKCCDCGYLYSSRRKEITSSNRFVWFRKWVLGKQTIEEIASASGYCTRQILRWFEEYLDDTPTWIINTSQPIHLLIDGTYYSNNHCLMLYRAENLKRTVYYRFTSRENADEIADDLINIRSMYNIIGVATDGGDNIIRAVQYVLSNIPRQRCVVHVQRECLACITRTPRTPEGRSFKTLVDNISDVRSQNDMLWWLKTYDRWRQDNEEYVMQTAIIPSTGCKYYVHDDLRKAFIHLRRALPNLFTYITNPGVPKTTNALECFFGHIKTQLRIHRGLSETRVDNFVKWYLFFADEKKRKER